jgi:hypothetical protein
VKIITGVLTSLIVANSVSTFGAETSRFKQCEVDLCGTDQGYERIRGQGAFSLIDKETRAVLDSEVKPQLNELMQIALDNRKAEYSLAETFLKKPMVELNSQNRAYLTIATYLAKLGNDYWKLLTSSDGINSQISAVKLQEKFPDLASAKVLQMTSVINTYLGSDTYYMYNVYSRYGFDMYVKTAGTKAKGDFKNARVMAENLLAELGPLVSAQVDIALLRKLEAGGKASAYEGFAAMNSLAQTYRLQSMINPEVRKATDQIKMTYADAVSFLDWNNRLKNTKELYANAEKLQAQKENVLLSCEKAIAGALSAAPSELRQRKTDELLEMVKTVSLETAPLYFSGSTLSTVAETVKATKFSKPLSRVESRSLAMGTVQYSLARAKAYRKDLMAETKSNRAKALAWKSLTESLLASENVYVSVQQACDRVKPQLFVDAAAPWLNEVVSGWQTNMFPEIGLGILAHELAHTISGAAAKVMRPLEKVGYSEVRKCAVDGHAKLAGSTIPSNFGQYAEEDWADAFAARVILNIGSKWPYISNYSCSLVHVSDKMDDLELQAPGGLGTHSSSFLRALQTQAQLGLSLPDSCLLELTDVEKEVVTRSCAK